jgi:protein KRI1
MAVDALLNPEKEDEPVPTHAQEQAMLRAETISAFQNAASVEDEDDLFVMRNPADDMDSAAYRQFLLETVGEEDVKAALAGGDDDARINATPKAPGEDSTTTKSRRKRKRAVNEAENEGFLLKFVCYMIH